MDKPSFQEKELKILRSAVDTIDEIQGKKMIKSPEVEMTGDDEFESLGKWIDPEAVLIESLSLALPTYPRAHGASLEETVLTEPGLEPLTEQAMKPFAGLSDLKDKLKGNFDT